MKTKSIIAVSIALCFCSSVYAAEDIHTGTVVVGSGIPALKQLSI